MAADPYQRSNRPYREEPPLWGPPMDSEAAQAMPEASHFSATRTRPARLPWRLPHDLELEVGVAERHHQADPDRQQRLGATRRGDVAQVDDVAPAEPLGQQAADLGLRRGVVPADADGMVAAAARRPGAPGHEGTFGHDWYTGAAAETPQKSARVAYRARA